MKKLTSITDENSILITVEFLESGLVLKVGERDIRRFELDLIVRDNITFNQLLRAIYQGLWSTLETKFKINPDSDNTTLVYTDSRNPDPPFQNPIIPTDQEQTILQRLGFTGRRGERRRIFEKKFLDTGAADPDKVDGEDLLLEAGKRLDEVQGVPDAEQAEIPVEKDGLLEDYLICWNVFLECCSAYREVTAVHRPEPSELEYMKYGIKRAPRIGISSINYNKVAFGERLARSDFFQICMEDGVGNSPLKDLGFITTTRVIFDPISWHTSGPLFDKTTVIPPFQETLPRYNISDSPLRRLNDEPLEIIAPTDPPSRGRMNLFASLLSPVLMAGTMIAVRYFLYSGTGTGMLLMSGSMALVSVTSAIINAILHHRDYKRSLQEWRKQYQAYIQQLLARIQRKQSEDVEKLHVLYPQAHASATEEASDLVSKALEISGDIFGRGQEHPHFLTVRVGISTDRSELVPSVFPIKGEKKEVVFASVKYNNIRNIDGYPFVIHLPHELTWQQEDGTEGFLPDLPADIARQYAYLKNAPVLLNLRRCGTLGIVFDSQYSFHPFLSNMLLELCFYHSPDDLQCVMLCDETKDWTVRQNIIRRYKHLPHFRELLGDLSAFAFNKADANMIFNKLLEILSERKQMDKSVKFPHILVIVLEEYEMKRHLVSEFLPVYDPKGEEDDRDSGYGVSFLFCKRYVEELPKYCGQVIQRRYLPPHEEAWFLLPHVQTVSSSPDDELRYGFLPDALPPEYQPLGVQEDVDRYYRAFKSISALYYERIAQSAGIPASVELFDIIGNLGETAQQSMAPKLQAYVRQMWDRQLLPGVELIRDTTKTLAVPIGRNSGDIVPLDLHEKGDGPHMLVAGTTGSGKTETILTFLVSLCTLYTPEEVNLLLMDMKGAGFVQRIGQDKNRLPHVVGTVTDLSGDETGTGTAYMLKRFLRSMNAEVARRKRLLSRMDVDSIDGYTEAKRDLQKHISTHSKLSMSELEELERLPKLPHLFLVIDEFTELLQFSAENDDIDFRKAISSLARVGRSLGFHIILISQNIEGAITPEIEVNSRARLCLKVATREASRDMIGTTLAASPKMPGNGRAYLLVGNGSRFEYFQSAYSGADINRNLEPPIVITHACTSGAYELFYDSESDSQEDARNTEKNQKVGVTQLKMMVDQIRQCFDGSGMEEPHCVFQQPLPFKCCYEYDWDSGEGEVRLLKMEKQ